MTIPFVSIGQDELDRSPDVSEDGMVICNNCGKLHKIQYGEEVLADGTKKPSMTLGFVRCDGKSFIAAVNGKLVNFKTDK